MIVILKRNQIIELKNIKNKISLSWLFLQTMHNHTSRHKRLSTCGKFSYLQEKHALPQKRSGKTEGKKETSNNKTEV